jgi:hypothetical protein
VSAAGPAPAAIAEAAYEHLLQMSDRWGVFEHADHGTARSHHGYCTDDMARVLIATLDVPRPTSGAVAELGAQAIRFVRDAQVEGGMVRNRRRHGGLWEDDASTDDCWGRSLWALGKAAAHLDDPDGRVAAHVAFRRSASLRSPWRRSMAFAGLGAGAVLSVHPDDEIARSLLLDAATAADRREAGARWAWPERRLAYANAVIAHVQILAGTTLDLPAVQRRGLSLLRWLVDHETVDGVLSVTPVGGAGPGDAPRRFDQQPIEVAALADAVALALAASGGREWAAPSRHAVDWFSGSNDLGVQMWDDATGGGYDGLTPGGPNRNQGAESALALITTMQALATAERPLAATS